MFDEKTQRQLDRQCFIRCPGCGKWFLTRGAPGSTVLTIKVHQRSCVPDAQQNDYQQGRCCALRHIQSYRSAVFSAAEVKCVVEHNAQWCAQHTLDSKVTERFSAAWLAGKLSGYQDWLNSALTQEEWQLV